jgi:hypothetical protein
MTWDEFQRSDPELAALGRERFDRTGLILLGTLRESGWPRITPVEVLITDGQLYLGMMWQSRKALDLLRDPRCTVHSTVSDRAGTEGEFKVYGYAVDVQDLEARQRYGHALYEKIQVRLEDDSEYHLFAVDIQSAAFVIIRNEEMKHQEWKAA